MKNNTWIVVFCCIAVRVIQCGIIAAVYALEQCPAELGGGTCPTNNTCCLRFDHKSGCIPSDLGALHGTCCDGGHTGCGVGYSCGARHACVAGSDILDPLVQTLPRYRLCQTDLLKQLHGWSVTSQYRQPYYTTHDLFKRNVNIAMAVIIVHGAARNADDYFCSLTAAIDQQSSYANDEVLLVAPLFAVVGDDVLHMVEDGVPFQWIDDGAGGPWRYGADAAKSETINWSSFDAVDAFTTQLVNKTLFPSLERVVIGGHSAGGQFAQRWSLMTNVWHNGPTEFRGVVANPSSYAYLTPLRYQANTWQRADKSACPEYNEWEWGLDKGGNFTARYVNEVRQRFHRSALLDRFRERSMVYLAGGQDQCDVPQYQRKGWCYSHGLEMTCMDRLQGRQRLERSKHYYDSLQFLGFGRHRRAIVPGVGHDHSLMFNSARGLDAIFGSGTQDAR